LGKAAMSEVWLMKTLLVLMTLTTSHLGWSTLPSLVDHVCGCPQR
jgi:hypothetical protein